MPNNDLAALSEAATKGEVSDTFDWADLLIDVICKRIEEGDPAAAAYLRTRIEAAFVPVERYIERNRMWTEQVLATNEATARAEAAEAENARLLRVIDAYLSATASNSNKRQIVTAAMMGGAK